MEMKDLFLNITKVAECLFGRGAIESGSGTRSEIGRAHV